MLSRLFKIKIKTEILKSYTITITGQKVNKYWKCLEQLKSRKEAFTLFRLNTVITARLQTFTKYYIDDELCEQSSRMDCVLYRTFQEFTRNQQFDRSLLGSRSKMVYGISLAGHWKTTTLKYPRSEIYYPKLITLYTINK